MNSLQKVAKQTGWQLVSKVATSLSTFVVLGLISRHYGEAGIGMFTLTLTYLSFFYVLVDFGFNAYVLERLSGSDDAVEWRKLFGLRLVWAAVLVIVCGGLAYILPFSSRLFVRSVLYGCLAIFGVSVVTSANAIFQRRFVYKYNAYITVLSSMSTAGMVGIIINFLPGVDQLVLAHLVGWLLAAVMALFFIADLIKQIRPIIDFKYILRNFRGVLPISATLVLNVVYFRIDSFILSSYKGLDEVGVYNLAYSVFQSILVLPTFIMNGFFPIMLDNLKVGLGVFKRQLLLAGVVLLVMSLGGIFLTVILSPLVVSLVSGGGFNGSVVALRILSLAFPAFFLSSLLMWTYVTLKQYKLMVAIYFAGLIVNFLANLMTIPLYSYVAAAWVTVLSEYLILILQIFMIYPVIKSR